MLDERHAFRDCCNEPKSRFVSPPRAQAVAITDTKLDGREIVWAERRRPRPIRLTGSPTAASQRHVGPVPMPFGRSDLVEASRAQKPQRNPLAEINGGSRGLRR
jgi:hypothetical protein